MDETTLDQVKNFMWLTTDAFDAQLQTLIDAALIDLRTSGVNGVEADPAGHRYILQDELRNAGRGVI